MDNPFDEFAKRKIEDNSEIQATERQDAEKIRVQFEMYVSNHKKIITDLGKFNPESIILKLYEVGFKNNLKYPEAKVVRSIQFAIFDGDGKCIQKSDGSTSNAASSDVFSAIKEITGVNHIKQWNQYHRLKNPQIFIFSITWKLILWSTIERIDYDTNGRVYHGPSIKLVPNELSISSEIVQPITPDNFSRILAKHTELIIDGKENGEGY